MKIRFRSEIKNGEELNEIDFTSSVEISKMNDFIVYEFLEPQNNIMNRIEVSSNIVNIFAGPSTIVLSLNELIQNDYYTEAGVVMFDSKMNKLEISDNLIEFNYELGQINNLFGKFKIKLEISE